MGDVIQIEWGQLDMLFEDMEEVRGQIATLDKYFVDNVCSTAGFDFEPFALKPLADAMGTLEGYFGTARGIVEKRYDALVHAAALTARDFDNRDGEVNYDFNKLLGGPHQVPRNADPGSGPGVEVRGISLDDPADFLKAPAEGKQKFPTEHDAPFQAVNEGWDSARDKVNECIKWCRDKGIDIFDELPEKSLEDFIVFPLTGDYYAIQQNASSCRNFAKGLRAYAKNFGKLYGKAQLAMKGQAGLALGLHIGLYGAVMRAISTVIDALAKVFDELAEMSEKLATKVEKIIRVLGQKLFKLMKFLLKRINVAVGIFMTLKDLAEKGTDFFKDLVDDVKTVANLIEVAFGLAEEVKAWAEEQADRIKTAQQVAEIARKLPHARATMDLGDVDDMWDTKTIKKSLKDLKTDFGDPEGKAWDDLNDKVDEGVEEAAPEWAPSPSDPDCSPAPERDLLGRPIDADRDAWHPPMAPPRARHEDPTPNGPRLQVPVPQPLPGEGRGRGRRG